MGVGVAERAGVDCGGSCESLRGGPEVGSRRCRRWQRCRRCRHGVGIAWSIHQPLGASPRLARIPNKPDASAFRLICEVLWARSKMSKMAKMSAYPLRGITDAVFLDVRLRSNVPLRISNWGAVSSPWPDHPWCKRFRQQRRPLHTVPR